ncbi:MAG: hypothetical protein CVV44_08180 [Spirochaetae bacterium HGW-Spirochaetae-1]|jgi:uncharacterized membrane protein YhhN|nr:MAG: hypothetical protein CVV44_08180 [Spirochaetae bacterium HGW-Spirochaetae-1]
MTSTVFLVIFFAFSIAHVAGEGFKLMPARYITKPFLMPSLALYYAFSAQEPSIIMIAAIAGGWLGDIFLMIPDPQKTRRFFKPGLVAFLLGHILYIAVFVACFSSLDIIPFYGWLIALLYLVTGIFAFNSIRPHAGPMLKAIAAYVIIIILMGISTVVSLGSVSLTGSAIAMVGAYIFMISDTLNAYNRFVKEIPNERVYTMSTYLLGQFLLIQGYLLF